MPPGAIAVHPDLALQVLVGERAREVDDAALRRAVRGAVRLAHEARVRRDVDDRAAAVEEVRDRGLAHEERAGEVHADDLLPLLERRLRRVREAADARAVEHQRRAARARSAAAATAGRTESGSDTSTVVGPGASARSAISATVFSTASATMSRHATAAPSAASWLAVARPSPEPAPVTSATRPSNCPISASVAVGRRNLTRRQIRAQRGAGGRHGRLPGSTSTGRIGRRPAGTRPAGRLASKPLGGRDREAFPPQIGRRCAQMRKSRHAR